MSSGLTSFFLPFRRIYAFGQDVICTNYTTDATVMAHRANIVSLFQFMVENSESYSGAMRSLATLQNFVFEYFLYLFD